MQRDTTNEKYPFIHATRGIYCINVVMATGYRFASQDTQSPFVEREGTGTEPWEGRCLKTSQLTRILFHSMQQTYTLLKSHITSIKGECFGFDNTTLQWERIEWGFNCNHTNTTLGSHMEITQEEKHSTWNSSAALPSTSILPCFFNYTLHMQSKSTLCKGKDANPTLTSGEEQGKQRFTHPRLHSPLQMLFNRKH